jgi:hypothetical protein
MNQNNTTNKNQGKFGKNLGKFGAQFYLSEFKVDGP